MDGGASATVRRVSDPIDAAPPGTDAAVSVDADASRADASPSGTPTARADASRSDAVPSPTDRGRRRREAVLDAAARLFRARGFHGVSVDDLGAAAGISGPGLYRHFPSKDAVLMAVLDRVWLLLRPALDRAADLPADEAVEVLLDAQLDLALGQPEAIVVLVRELRHLPDDYRERASRNRERWVAGWVRAIRELHPDLDAVQAREVATAVHGLIDSAALYDAPPSTPAELSAQRTLLDRLARAALGAARLP